MIGPTLSLHRSRSHTMAWLSRPPEFAWIERVEPIGEKVCEFFLPLEYAPTFNRTGRAGTAGAGFALGRLKKSCLRMMQIQFGGKAREPLDGRPHVVAIRFSSVASDADSGWSKIPVDRLRAAKNGLGIIRDDTREAIKLSTWWERAPKGAGFVYLSVWTGVEL